MLTPILLSCLLTWGGKNITPDSFSIKPIEIAGNGEDGSKSANILTSFDNLVKRVDIFACFLFCQILRRLFEYYNVGLKCF